MMRDHHRRALDLLVEQVASDGIFDAVILSGSLAKGTASDASDVDVYLVVPEDDYEDRRQRHDLAWWAPCDYEGGYVDGKIVSRAVLEAAAARGTEPMRSSFVGSQVLYATTGDLQQLVDRIPVYPEEHRDRNLRDFFVHLALHAGYFGPQALERDDPFLLAHSLSNTVLFAGRLLLAYNRMLFPCPKQLLATVGQAPSLPDGFIDASDALLREPDAMTLFSYLQLVGGFADWGIREEEVVTLFMELDEWSWLEHEPAVAQR